jgi:hypothetical protein
VTCPAGGGPLVLDTPVVTVGELTGFPDQLTLMTEIHENGPVVASFDVYEDFFSYSGGVYQHVTGSRIGGNVGLIVGWGNDGTVDYWIVKHCWGTWWGDGGYFLIRRGDAHEDNCDFAEWVWFADVGASVVAVPESPGARPFLAQNRPNPFNPRTVITFRVPADGPTTLRVYDVAGRLVRTLVDGNRVAGRDHDVAWDGRDDGGRPEPAGLYFYRLETPGHIDTKRMLLVK